MAATKRMALSVLIQGTGAHPASWMNTGTAHDPSTELAHFAGLARLAERGLFDLFFVADTPAARTDNLQAWSRFPMFMNVLEPLTLLSALAAMTTRIGLGATASTSFTEPYNLARQFASLDHLSGGRAGWNVVTSANDYAARNFGLDRLPPHAERYARAREYVAVVEALWDSWEDGAFVNDVAARLNFDPAKLHVLHHEGAHFRLHGALNMARPPQGRPVIIQAGASETGRDFAAETAEVVFSSEEEPEAARRVRDDLRARMARFGRDPEGLRVLAGFPVVLGSSRAEAEDRYATMQASVHPSVGLMRLATDLEVDLSDLPLDEPVPPARIPAASNHHRAYFDGIARMIREEGLTLRQLCARYDRGHRTVCGTPAEVADAMEAWFAGGACDGFMLLFHAMPGGMEDFVRGVVPELQRRGLFRTAYEGRTLREHLGLTRPASRYARGGPPPPQ